MFRKNCNANIRVKIFTFIFRKSVHSQLKINTSTNRRCIFENKISCGISIAFQCHAEAYYLVFTLLGSMDLLLLFTKRVDDYYRGTNSSTILGFPHNVNPLNHYWNSEVKRIDYELHSF